ncbi:ATPase associated with various cellular activities family protein [Bordetella holmesii ATCC 51541]|nr:ATPase associated with various cellular activities family protein [Bordetella holmesii ATCC 51541]
MAFVEARSARHEFITVEHLLLSLLDNASAVEVLRACAANLDDLHRNLRQFVTENTPVIPSGAEVDTQPTLGFQRVIQRAIMHVSAGGTGKKPVTGANVLVAIFGEKDSHAVYYLQQQGVTRLDVVNFLSHGISKQPQEEPSAVQKEQQSPGEEGGEARQSPLDQYATDLNAAALAGRIDPLIGREHEVERVIQVLCRRRKNNPLLVGEAGVGKTAIAEGLAWRITRGEVPEILQAAQVYSLDMGALLAGTKYRGDFEQRLKGVLKQIRGNPHAVLFIDESTPSSVPVRHRAVRWTPPICSNRRCRPGSSSALARPPIPSIAASSRKTTRCRAAFRKSMSPNPASNRPCRFCAA